MNVKRKVIIKMQQINWDIFSKSNFETNEDGNAKRFNAQKYYLSKGIIKN